MTRIEDIVENLVEEYHTRDPEVIAQGLNIHLYEREDFYKLLGMYARVAGRSCIFLNANLEDEERRLVLAHELGHAVLHGQEEGIRDILEMTLFQPTNREEYEANRFAADLLFEEEEIVRLAEEGYDIVSIAQILHTDMSLLLVKLHEMQKKGYQLDLPDPPRADFLAK